jgi:hypothetical protein
MSYLQFTKNNQLYTDKLSGDNALNIFDEPLTNVYLDKYAEDINEVVTYNDIQVLYLLKNNDIIQNLPQSLKYLYIKSATLQELPISDIVAPNIEVIQIDFTNLHIFPDISKCINLKELTINHSNLETLQISYLLPPKLQILNLRYNNISNLDFTIFKTHPKLKINLSYNNLTNETINNILMVNNKADIKMQNKYKHNRINHTNYNNIEIQNFMNTMNNNNLTNTPTPIVGNVLVANTQTVHLSSINKTIVTSYEVINKYIAKHKLTHYLKDKNLINEINTNFQNNKLNDCSSFLLQKLSEQTKHSLIHKSYIELLSVIWNVIYTHSQKTNLIERLNTEMFDSVGKCFTGCVNRLINVLVGYIDGVIVSISLKEEIQMSIQRLIEKLNKQEITYKETKEEMVKLLNQDYDIDKNDLNNYISEEYKNTWLYALNDYRPDAIRCLFYENIYGHKQEEKVKCYISYDNVIYDSSQNFDEEKYPIGEISDETQCIAKIYSYEYDKIVYPDKFLKYRLH